MPPRPPLRARAARPVLVAAWVLGACLLNSCGGEAASPAGPPTPPPAPPTPPNTARLVEIWAEVGSPPARPAVDSLEMFLPQAARARGRMSDSSVVDVLVQWTSSDTTVVKPLGSFGVPATTGVTVDTRAAGRATITLQHDSLSASFTVVVTPARVRQIILRRGPASDLVSAPAVVEPDSVVIRKTSQYVAQCGSLGYPPVPGARLTWRTSDATHATVDSAGTVTARALGPVRLVASCTGVLGEVVDTSLQLVVRPPRAARIAFTYVPDSLMLNHTDSVRAVLYDSAGRPTAIPAQVQVPAWSSFPSAFSNGLLRGLSLGDVEIEASGDGLAVRHALHVYAVPAGPPRTFPPALVLAPGTRALLAAFPADLDGLPISGPTLTYESADPSVASVTPAGIVSASALGGTTIHVRTGALQTDVPVSVVPPGAFHMAVRPATAAPLSAVLADGLAQAAGRWESTILGGLPTLRLALPKDACGLDAPPAEELVVDGALVFASADSIDGPGGVLAAAGPCVIREDGRVAVGRILIDSADVARLAASGQLVTVLQHELAHVLGIGTLWNRTSLGYVSKSGTEWGYAGPRGLRVGAWWGRTNAAGAVPLGEANGPGNGHWSEAAFGAELMTPVLNRGANPLSLITLEALADLGYTTSAAAAELFQLYSGANVTAARAGRPRATVGAAPAAPFDRVITPRWRVTAAGRLARIPR